MQHHEYTAMTGRVLIQAPNHGQVLGHLIDPTITKTLCGLYQVATAPMLDEGALIPKTVTGCGRCTRLERKHYPEAS